MENFINVLNKIKHLKGFFLKFQTEWPQNNQIIYLFVDL